MLIFSIIVTILKNKIIVEFPTLYKAISKKLLLRPYLCHVMLLCFAVFSLLQYAFKEF